MFCRPTPGSMRSTFHPILTPVWKFTKDQRLEWRKMPSMAFTSNHLVRFECFRLFSTTMGFSVNHIVLTSFKHICLFRYYINLIELFYVPRSPCVQTLPSYTMGKEGFNIWTSSTEELLPLTHLSTIPMLETSGFWHIFFLLFLIMIELVNAQYRLCKISKNMFHSCLVFLLTALSQPPWFLLQPGACQPRGNPWEIRPQWPGEQSSNHRFHISEIWPKWLLRWFDILRCVGMNATCTEPEAEGNETRIR